MKKRLVKLTGVLMSLSMIFSLAACGDSDNKVDSELSVAEEVQSYIDSIDMEYAYDLAETLAYDEKYWDNELG